MRVSRFITWQGRLKESDSASYVLLTGLPSCNIPPSCAFVSYLESSVVYNGLKNNGRLHTLIKRRLVDIIHGLRSGEQSFHPS